MLIDRIEELDKRYYMNVFEERLPADFVRGEGMRLYDSSGRAYMDFLGGVGVNVLGYSDELFKQTLREQVDRIIHSSEMFYIEEQAQLAQQLCQTTSYAKVLLSNSGSEANEYALKLAQMRAANRGLERPNFVALKNSFHGRTLATVAASFHWNLSGIFPASPLEFRFIENDNIDAVSEQIDENTCGVFLEIIQSEGGVIPLSAFL